MHSRSLKYSLGLAFCLTSLAATALGCSNVEPGAEESQQTDDLSAAQPVSAARRAEIERMPKLDRAQLIALLGGNVPAAALAFCSGVDGTQCAPPTNGIIRPCGGFQGVCGSTGTEDIVPLSFLCISNVCTPVATGPQQTISCTVPSDGKACSTGCNTPTTCDYSSTCDVSANKIQRCFSGGTCSNNQCVNQTFTDSVVGTCTRDTVGLTCPISELPPHDSPCERPKVAQCTVSHVCGCLLDDQ